MESHRLFWGIKLTDAGGLIMQYSFYPVRAMDDETARYLEGLEQLADKWGLDLTRDLKPTQPIDNKMKGANHGRR